MIFVITLLFLISLALTQPIGKAIPAEEAFTEIKKNILECIAKDVNASIKLKNYVNDNLNNGYKEPLNFSNFRENEIDRNIIRECRRKAFLFSSKKRIKPLNIFSKGHIITKINN